MMAAAIAFALWFSSTPTPPTSGELVPNGGTTATAPAGQTAVVHERVLLKLVTPAIVDASEHWLKQVYHSPIGTEQHMVVDGRPLVFILQWHYHPPGFVGAPTGKHKGVTVFEER
jgi:hypothetical protein